METEGPATIVSTSTLELGINVGDLDLVLQLDAPLTVSSFLQRMGRTGRRDGPSQHIEFFTSNADSLLQAVALVNLARRNFVEKIDPTQANLPVFLHQILAQVVERTAIRKEALWQALRGPSPFHRLDRKTFDKVIDHLLHTRILEMLEHRLVFGEEGERIFGRMNFFDLYSVFETPDEMTVKTRDGHVIGTLETLFVRRMHDKRFTFLLAGRTWLAVDVDLSRGLLIAMPFVGGEAPLWHSAGGFLGREVAEEMRNVLISGEEVPFVDEAGREQLRRMSEELRPVLSHDRCPISSDGGKVRVLTYAGGRINATIAALLEDGGTVEVRDFGDLDIELRHAAGGYLSAKFARDALLSLRHVDERSTRADLARLVKGKHRGKLTKFQPYLPPELEGAYLADKLFDLEGMAQIVRESSFSVL